MTEQRLQKWALIGVCAGMGLYFGILGVFLIAALVVLCLWVYDTEGD